MREELVRMMRGRLLALAVFMALAAAACGSDPGTGSDSFTTATPAAPPRSPSGMPPSGIAPPSGRCEEDVDFWGVLIRQSTIDLVEQLFGDGLLAPLGEQQAVAGTDLVLLTSTTRDELADLVRNLDNAFTYDGDKLGTDADAALVLAALGVSPNYKLDSLRPNPRVNGGPGSAPVQVDPPANLPKVVKATGESTKSVLVVDTGYQGDAVKMLDGLVDGEIDSKVQSAELDPPFGGHGTFIAGVLSLNKPTQFSKITVLDLWSGLPKPDDNVYDSDFASLAVGPRGSGSYTGVNLSVGSYACSVAELLHEDAGLPKDDPAGYLQPIAQRVALERFVQGNANVKMAASAGNDHSDHPVFPAAFSVASTPDKTLLTLTNPTAGEQKAFDLWLAASPDAKDLRDHVDGVGAKAGPGNKEYSNFGPWVTVKDVEGCHTSLMPQGEWKWPASSSSAPAPYALGTGWAWWCGTSFAAPYWLTQNL